MSKVKLFSVVGVSTFEGKTKFRYANDISRSKVLERNGHTDINLIELPEPLDKNEATLYFQQEQPAPETAGTRDAKGRFVKQAFQFVAA